MRCIMKYTFNKNLPIKEKYMEVSYMVQDCLNTLIEDYDMGLEFMNENLKKFKNSVPFLSITHLQEIISEDEISAWYNSLESDITIIEKDSILENIMDVIDVDEDRIYIKEEFIQESFLQTIGSLAAIMGASIVASKLINAIADRFDSCKNNCRNRFSQEDNKKLRKAQEKNCVLDCEIRNYQQAINILQSKKREVCNDKNDPVKCMNKIDDKIQKLEQKINTNQQEKTSAEQQIRTLQQQEANENE